MQNLTPFIESAGYIGIFGMIFAETGLFFGFIFPGDTLLFVAGFLASQGYFSIAILLLGTIFFAIVGDNIGYWTGKKLGPKIFVREDSFFFRKAHVAKAKNFFDKHGRKTIVLARYVPVVRTFSPVIAGVVEMPYAQFFLFNILGAIFWCGSVLLIGYFLGKRISNIDDFILPIVAGIFLISFIPVAIHAISARNRKTIIKE